MNGENTSESKNLEEAEKAVAAAHKTRLSELAWLFFKLGSIAFGGPAAHIALMEAEIVNRRQWIKREKFLDLLGATNLIPGPNSTELAIHIGYERAGWSGLVVAGVCFILPAALIVTVLAWGYVNFGKIPEANILLYAVKPVIIAVVVQAIWNLTKTAVKTVFLMLIGLIVLFLSFLGINELALLFGAGAITAFVWRLKQLQQGRQTTLKSFLPSAPLFFQTVSQTTVTAFSLWSLFLFFLKVGSVLFGSGYVLLAFLQRDLVERWGWLSNEQLLDAVAVGQITPGPVFTTATFIGYLLAGTPGAIIATVGIFLPGFVFVGLSGWIVPRLRHSPLMAAFLDGVNVASLALIVFVIIEFGKTALVDWFAILLFLVNAGLLLRYKINSAWLMMSGAIIGFLIFWFKH